jgi:hypothetical protein
VIDGEAPRFVSASREVLRDTSLSIVTTPDSAQAVQRGSRDLSGSFGGLPIDEPHEHATANCGAKEMPSNRASGKSRPRASRECLDSVAIELQSLAEFLAVLFGMRRRVLSSVLENRRFFLAESLNFLPSFGKDDVRPGSAGYDLRLDPDGHRGLRDFSPNSRLACNNAAANGGTTSS